MKFLAANGTTCSGLFSLCHVQLKKALRDQILTICSTCLYTLNNSLPTPHELAT